ncbi:MAG: glycosyltransferase family 39 protein [Eubacteriales bacterium]|nr:glycosyltransferase family 39 protein [Eubacteriales bacterium]
MKDSRKPKNSKRADVSRAEGARADRAEGARADRAEGARADRAEVGRVQGQQPRAKKRDWAYITTAACIFASLILKLALIFVYGNRLSLNSDDLNYVKSAKVLLEQGSLVFHEYNEPTVFIMPLYPSFLALVFGIFGTGFPGLQAVRVIQALMGTASLILIFLIARRLLGKTEAVVSTVLAAFYIPNLVTPGFILTETMFTLLLLLLLYLSLVFTHEINGWGFAAVGVVYALATLIRPTIALYPVVLAFYMLVFKKIRFRKVVKCTVIMGAIFAILMAPWWLRNYREYGEFIPLAASGGNPMLQGTYIDYEQTPENVTYYKLGENAFETNKIETEVAKQRIKAGFKGDFTRYLEWYTLGKTKYFWGTVFYWKEYAGIPTNLVIIYHFVLLAGFGGLILLGAMAVKQAALPFLIMLYFNLAHCAYMAFDRYAYPCINILVIFAAYFFIELYLTIKNSIKTSNQPSISNYK